MSQVSDRLHLRLPATSANLGPGFDALGLAMDLALEIDAVPAEEFHIEATGRNAQACAALEDNLILNTYTDVLLQQGIDAMPLQLSLRNGIPLGMGCGSSAAALVAGVALAAYYGNLQWNAHRILTEASIREGHPDNVAACVLGGLTISGMSTQEGGSTLVSALALQPKRNWQVLLAMPQASLSTSKARALLPESYSKADAIANIQNVALLTAAFAQGASDLLRTAMQDRIHQPYRAAVCALLPRLLPLAGHASVLGVALSGAGPSVLLLLEEGSDRIESEELVRQALSGGGEPLEAELVWTSIGGAAELGLA